MTNYYRPSYAAEENIFLTPRDQRPFIDAPMVPQPGLLPPHLRKLSSGPARWSNLIVGLAVECALRDGLSVAEIRSGFDRRRVSFGIDILMGENDPAADEPIEFYGGVSLRTDGLTIEGGTNDVSAAIGFRRGKDGLYVPLETSGLVESNEMQMTTLPNPLIDAVARTPAGIIPDEFKIAFEFSTLEETITSCYDVGAVAITGAVSFT